MAQVEQATGDGPGGRWTRLASFGLLMVALGPILMLAAGFIWGLDISEDVMFFGITALVALLGAFLVRRAGTWAKVAGIVCAVLVGMALFWTAFGLLAPGSVFDFVPGLLVIPGAIIAIVACVAALRARKATDVAPAAKETKIMRVVAVVVGALALLSAILTFVGQESVDGSDAELTVVLKDFEFDKPDYEFAAGSKVLVRNDDPFLHTFTIEDFDIDEVITPGSEVLVTIPEGASGEQTVFCQPHTNDPENPGDGDMAAKVTIN